MERFRGGFPATIDAKGRLKLPTRLRERLEESHGREVFVCSLFPWELLIYPLAEWEVFEDRLSRQPQFNPAVRKVLERVNYGQQLDVDEQGRLLVPAFLREMVEIGSEVMVSGRGGHLAVTARDRAAEVLRQPTVGDDELEALAGLGL